MVPRLLAPVALVLGIACIVSAAGHDESFDFPFLPFDSPVLDYANEQPDDAVTRLQKKLDSGAVRLRWDEKLGYLPDLLKQLGIDQDSQVLVFSKTSFQAPNISPAAPRALYFNDEAMVGYVPRGSLFELAALDPRRGMEFYVFDRAKQTKPHFARQHLECLACHMVPATLNVPGIEIASVIATFDGSPRSPGGGTVVDSRTDLATRWGGWYVTGNAGRLVHRGNAFSTNPDRPDTLDTHASGNLTSLASRFDLTPYPRPTSDIVALMTLEHQTRATSLLTRLGWETRLAMAEGKLEEFRKGRMDVVINQLVSYFLFAQEAKIADPISGNSTFAKSFMARGPRDKQGRSLRDFDLTNRHFRYPLSYMVYSPAFDALPDAARLRVYERLFEILSGKTEAPQFAHLSPSDRSAILEIVRDTRPNLPEWWKTSP